MDENRMSKLKSIPNVYGKTYRKGQSFFTFKDNNLISIGIAFYTKGNKPLWNTWSHTGKVVGENLGIESSNGKVHLVDLTKYFDDPHCHISFREPYLLDKLGSEHFEDAAEKYLGTKYDYSLIIGQWIVNSKVIGSLMSDKTKQRVLKEFNRRNKMICCEYAYQVDADYGYCPETFIRNDFLWTPETYWQAGYFKQLKDDLNELKV